MKITYYKIPLGWIPFKDIPSLEDININYCYCSYLSLTETMGIDLNLVTIFDCFSERANVSELQDTPFLFGQVIAENPSKRGKAKFQFMESLEIQVDEDYFPHMKFSNVEHLSVNESSGNWFYVDKGKYMIIRGIKSNYESVWHLEDIVMYGDSVIRLRIIAELLKRNVKKGLVQLSVDDYKEIAFTILKADPTGGGKDEIKRSIVNGWIPMMLSVPVHKDIPVALRGRVAP